jgi:hypothetical protein
MMKRDEKYKRASMENENKAIEGYPVSHNFKVMMMIYFNDKINFAGNMGGE